MRGRLSSRVRMEATSPALLVRDLEAFGVSEFLARFPADRPRLADWAAALDSLPADVRPLHEFLLLGRPVMTAALPRSLRDFFPVLQTAGILDRSGETAQLVGTVLMRPRGVWLFAAPPSPFETDLYFGADSVELTGQLDVRPGSSVLDLCSGTGLQALATALRGATVHAVEINKVAVAVAEANIILNGCEDRVSLWSGDLYAPLPEGTVYDQVIANLPFLPGAANGPDGFAVGRAILRRLSEWLAPDGTACLTALLPITAEGAVLPEGVREFAWRTGRELVVRLGEGWAVDAGSSLVQTLADEAAGSEGDFAACVTAIVGEYERRGVIAARTAFLHFGRAAGATAVRFADPASVDPVIEEGS
ncbi:methyltransferase [Streptomyces sp. NPDC005492]|uniref:methyltransferase n=1 Tax=Streptomyces sp. NPDC005492 TaxID=3156883 RepID=UPI0033ADC64D